MIQNLEYEIRAFIIRTGNHPSIIVMHPLTWQKLCEEVWDNVSGIQQIDKHHLNLKYRGFRVLRSLDMEEELFEVK